MAVRQDGTALRTFGNALSFHNASGRFTLVSYRDITECSTIVTRRSLTKAVPYAPSTVELSAGTAINTVGVQVRTLLANGGAFTNQTFYAAILC